MLTTLVREVRLLSNTKIELHSLEAEEHKHSEVVAFALVPLWNTIFLLQEFS